MMNPEKCFARAADLERRADEAASYDEMLAWQALVAEWRDLAEFARRQDALVRTYGGAGR